MNVSSVTNAGLWDSGILQGTLTAVPRPQRHAAVAEGNAASVRSANDTYTAGAGLVNGIPVSLQGGTSSSLSPGQGAAASTANGDVLSQLDAAISAAATDGSQDSNWMDDLVSYASGLGGGAGSASAGSGAGGALAKDLGAIQGVIQRVTEQFSRDLTAQGGSASLVSAAVNALSTSLTLNSLGAVAQQIAAKTGSPDTFTVTSSVVTISANGTSTIANVAGQAESFTGTSGNFALVSTGGTASVVDGNSALANGTNTDAEGFGYRFAISESGPDGSSYAGTEEVGAVATVASSTGAGQSGSSTAALEEGATVYENANGSSAAGTTAMVLLSDWEKNLESTATQKTDTANATTDANAQPPQSGARTLSDFLNAAAHVLFKQALAMIQGIFGTGNANATGEMGRGNLVDVYA